MDDSQLEAFVAALYHNHSLSSRQHALFVRVLHGETIEQILKSRTMNGRRSTLFAELQKARSIVACALIEQKHGDIRLGVTADTGHHPQWKPDKVLMGKDTAESGWPLEQLKLHAKKGKRF